MVIQLWNLNGKNAYLPIFYIQKLFATLGKYNEENLLFIEFEYIWSKLGSLLVDLIFYPSYPQSTGNLQSEGLKYEIQLAALSIRTTAMGWKPNIARRRMRRRGTSWTSCSRSIDLAWCQPFGWPNVGRPNFPPLAIFSIFIPGHSVDPVPST